jgi:hypothetical protein
LQSFLVDYQGTLCNVASVVGLYLECELNLAAINMANRPTMSRTSWAVVGVMYAAVVAAAVGGLHWARGSLLDTLGTKTARENWEAWRVEAGRQAAGEGPVRRNTPKSPEPPTLVLLRDYYGVCIAGVWLFTTLLFAVLVFVSRGIAVGRRDQPGGSPALRSEEARGR